MVDSQRKHEITQLHAELCSAVADLNRILLLYALDSQPATVNALSQEVGISQSATSRHLKVLRAAGLVSAERKGQTVVYQLREPRVMQSLNILRTILQDRLARKAALLIEES